MNSGPLTIDQLRSLSLPPVAFIGNSLVSIASWDWVVRSLVTGELETHSGSLAPAEAGLGVVDQRSLGSITLETPHPPTNMAVWAYRGLTDDGLILDVDDAVASVFHLGSEGGSRSDAFTVTVVDAETKVTFSTDDFWGPIRLFVFQAGWELDETTAGLELIGATWASYVA